MKFEQRASVKAPPDKLWAFLMDIPAVGGCIPGVGDVQEMGDGSYQGTLRVKVGPIGLNLAGKLTMEDIDEEGHRGVMVAEAKDRRVAGGVRVRMGMRLEPQDAENTDVVIETETTFMGKLGEFGQPIIRRKADGMMKDFTKNLQQKVASG